MIIDGNPEYEILACTRGPRELSLTVMGKIGGGDQVLQRISRT